MTLILKVIFYKAYRLAKPKIVKSYDHSIWH